MKLLNINIPELNVKKTIDLEEVRCIEYDFITNSIKGQWLHAAKEDYFIIASPPDRFEVSRSAYGSAETYKNTLNDLYDKIMQFWSGYGSNITITSESIYGQMIVPGYKLISNSGNKKAKTALMDQPADFDIDEPENMEHFEFNLKEGEREAKPDMSMAEGYGETWKKGGGDNDNW